MAYNPSVRLNSLTKTYTPFANCTTLAYAGGSQAWYYQTCSGGALYDNPDCWPPATFTTTNAASSTAPPGAGPLNGYGVYSPGLACPAGYYTACTAAILPNGSPSPIPPSGTSFGFQFSLYPGQTAHGCCPTGFTPVHYGTVQTCVSTVSTSTILAVETCGESTYAGLSAVTIPQSGTPSIVLAAPLIQLNFRAGDLTPMTGASASQPSSMHPTSTSSHAPASSLGGGAEAGIGVGVAFAVIAAIILGILLLRHNRKKKRGSWMKAEPVDPHEMDGGPAAGELHAPHGVSELSGVASRKGVGSPAYELSAMSERDETYPPDK